MTYEIKFENEVYDSLLGEAAFGSFFSTEFLLIKLCRAYVSESNDQIMKTKKCFSINH